MVGCEQVYFGFKPIKEESVITQQPVNKKAA
jgi:hypothetical protein